MICKISDMFISILLNTESILIICICKRKLENSSFPFVYDMSILGNKAHVLYYTPSADPSKITAAMHKLQDCLQGLFLSYKMFTRKNWHNPIILCAVI